MLKLNGGVDSFYLYAAATFGWLCVETLILFLNSDLKLAATFGWLCVETEILGFYPFTVFFAATFGWLCVETSLFGMD